MARQIYVNLPVKNLQRTKAFFTALGFSFEPKFSNENAACMVIAENIFVMLLIESFFKTFTKKRNLRCNQKYRSAAVFVVR